MAKKIIFIMFIVGIIPALLYYFISKVVLEIIIALFNFVISFY